LAEIGSTFPFAAQVEPIRGMVCPNLGRYRGFTMSIVATCEVMPRLEIDALLIDACRSGDHGAQRRLFLASKDFVYTTARCFFPDDESTARDVTQDVFVKLLARITQFRGDSGFRTWLYRMVIHVCIDETRRRRRWTSVDEYDSEANLTLNSTKPPSDSGEQAELSRLVQAAVGKLTPKLKAVMVLKYFEGLSYDEIAEALGTSPGTVASRMNRGHRELARRLMHLKDEFLIGDR
jgi:RNA polymerase sigma-70 factor (ECF subfamily)